jgi:hypothetical protein
VQTPPAAQARISVAPGSGPAGARVTVTGAGWTAGVPVRLEHLDPDGAPTGATATATPDADGRFSAALTLEASSSAPGRHAVRAADGRSTALAAYQQTG